MGALADVQHVGRDEQVAVAEGDPGADLGAECAQVEAHEPGALQVRHEAAEGALDGALAQPEAHAVQRVPPAEAATHVSLMADPVLRQQSVPSLTLLSQNDSVQGLPPRMLAMHTMAVTPGRQLLSCKMPDRQHAQEASAAYLCTPALARPITIHFSANVATVSAAP